MSKYFIIAIFSGFLSSFSQVLLKKGSEKNRKSILQEYLNPYVIIGYFIMIACMLMTVIAFKGVPFKYSAVLESLGYIYIMILSRMIIKEAITKRKVIGNIMIIIGVIVFSLGK